MLSNTPFKILEDNFSIESLPLKSSTKPKLGLSSKSFAKEDAFTPHKFGKDIAISTSKPRKALSIVSTNQLNQTAQKTTTPFHASNSYTVKKSTGFSNVKLTKEVSNENFAIFHDKGKDTIDVEDDEFLCTRKNCDANLDFYELVQKKVEKLKENPSKHSILNHIDWDVENNVDSFIEEIQKFDIIEDGNSEFFNSINESVPILYDYSNDFNLEDLNLSSSV